MDMHDNIRWEEGTIFEVKEMTTRQGRKVLMASVGFRIYRENGKKSDELGRFDGWSSKYDEMIPIFNPRLMPHLSHVGRQVAELEDDVDDGTIDDVIEPEAGHDRVYAVPRVGVCVSSKFISNLNRFGNNGGLRAILDTMATGTIDENLTLTTMGYMITMLSMPAKLFHKDWMAEFAT